MNIGHNLIKLFTYKSVVLDIYISLQQQIMYNTVYLELKKPALVTSFSMLLYKICVLTINLLTYVTLFSLSPVILVKKLQTVAITELELFSEFQEPISLLHFSTIFTGYLITAENNILFTGCWLIWYM